MNLTREECLNWIEELERRAHCGMGLDWDERQLLHELKEYVIG